MLCHVQFRLFRSICTSRSRIDYASRVRPNRVKKKNWVKIYSSANLFVRNFDGKTVVCCAGLVPRITTVCCSVCLLNVFNNCEKKHEEYESNLMRKKWRSLFIAIHAKCGCCHSIASQRSLKLNFEEYSHSEAHSENWAHSEQKRWFYSFNLLTLSVIGKDTVKILHWPQL